MTVRIIVGDALDRLAELGDASVHCVVTSPPYWGLRDYGVAGQIGLEPDFRDYIATMVAVFREVRRVLRPDGTVWLNLGDSYAGGGNGGGGNYAADRANWREVPPRSGQRAAVAGLKPKDLIGMPWRVAFALQEDSWWLRSEIIWHKLNPMPESVTDRPTTAHEHLFLLTKSARYWYDAEAIMEPSSLDSHARSKRRRSDAHKWANGGPGDQTIAKGAPSAGRMLARAPGVSPKSAEPGQGIKFNSSFESAVTEVVAMRNKRSVWPLTGEPFSDAHFATFPPALVEPCILAGCPKDGTVLDPFLGAGTTALAADRLGRHAIGIEINPEYAAMAERRLRGDAGMFAEVAAE